MLKQLWNTLKCRVNGHPYETYGTHYEIIPIEFSGFFSSGVQTIMLVKCSNCRATIGRVRNDS